MSGTLVGAEARPASGTIGEPILGWRVWTLHGNRNGSRVAMRPIAGSAAPWPAFIPATAACTRGRRHEVPGLDCTCGLHATKDPDFLHRARDPAVVGSVALWGRVVEHEYGYRAAFAYPQRLMLVCHLCFWQWGPARSSPSVVARLRRGRMVPLCEEHLELSRRYGYPLPRLSAARQVEEVLLSTYAVDVLRMERTQPARPAQAA